MKISFWSPLSPSGSGIADYSEELLPHLAERGVELHLFVEDGPPENRDIRERFRWHRARDYERVKGEVGFDLDLYQIGNNAHHRFVLKQALRVPGVVVLHDLVLQHLFLGLSVERSNPALYLSEMRRAYGERGAALGRQIAVALGSDLLATKFPLCERLVERSYGALVLTRHMERALERRLGSAGPLIGRAPHHYSPPPRLPVSSALEARRHLALPEDAFLVGSFGLATRAKRLDRALAGFERLVASGADARFLIVGEIQKSYDLKASPTLKRLGDRVVVTGRQPIERFYTYLLACDVVVNLRFPSAGEISGTLIRTLGMGKPVLVSNLGPFTEFPEHVVAPIDVGPPEIEEIEQTLRFLHEHPEYRDAMGRFAREHVASAHTLEMEAEAYVTFLERVIEARRSGRLEEPGQQGPVDLAASVMATLSDLPLGRTFGVESVRAALRSATDLEGRDYQT